MMELPQPRPFGAEGKKAMHDFLSLYSHSSVQQDPRPSQGGYLKTHDFLQPLEGGKSIAKEENTVEITDVEKPPPPAPPPSVEHLLPGGIGTYSISHISYFNQMVPKPEGNVCKVAQASSTDRNGENSNCSSYSGSGFTLWEESAVNKGKTGKQNAGEKSIARDLAGKLAQWTSERPVQSSSNHRNRPSAQKNQSFMEMIKSAKCNGEEEDDDDDEEFLIKKEGCSSLKGVLTVNIDGKCTDQKANTPRSKHSATEQRRRGKINDRFQMLRELIPHSDQKRDKASFLLEVIEYIQFLQEKVDKYEGSFQGWSHETAKLIPWSNSHRPAENFVDPSRGINNGSGPALMFAAKHDENNMNVSPAILKSALQPLESGIITATAFKAMEDPPASTSKSVAHPMPLQSSIFTPVGIGSTVSQLPPRMTSDAENRTSQLPLQLRQSKACKTECAISSDKIKEQELTIEGGTISIASVYSQGLLNTLTQALQSSGVDLSQASLSVQIDLGKRANNRPTSSTSIFKDSEVPSTNQAIACSRVGSSIDDSSQAPKRLKTCKN